MSKVTIEKWPNGAKVAVMITVLYESWSDGEIPLHCPMALATPLRPGTVDMHGANWALYGPETGVWRIMDILERYRIKASFCTNGQIVERYPASVRHIHDAGHEIAAHSYNQDLMLPYMSLAEETAMIDRCTEVIARTIGEAPTGWISPRATATPHTADLLAERGYIWHGDYNDTDLPYIVHSKHGPLVALMHSDFTDIRVIRGSPRDFLQVHRDMLDFLRQSKQPEIINISIHTHFGGRPLIASMFAQILEYYTSFKDIWFVRHDELAKWTKVEVGSTEPVAM